MQYAAMDEVAAQGTPRLPWPTVSGAAAGSDVPADGGASDIWSWRVRTRTTTELSPIIISRDGKLVTIQLDGGYVAKTSTILKVFTAIAEHVDQRELRVK
jgi:hypothetical protein